jgi:glycine/serine hydroxymethyltransferase
MGEAEMRQIADWMDRVITSPSDDIAEKVFGEVRETTRKFPAPGISI